MIFDFFTNLTITKASGKRAVTQDELDGLEELTYIQKATNDSHTNYHVRYIYQEKRRVETSASLTPVGVYVFLEV